ncbi:hypothetical protein L579_1407 [Pantoea sp. AS-PWVM4]|nr:hypothetical protein L579_1407 [Pantoea sp. AS-PWVM4]
MSDMMFCLTLQNNSKITSHSRSVKKSEGLVNTSDLRLECVMNVEKYTLANSM